MRIATIFLSLAVSFALAACSPKAPPAPTPSSGVANVAGTKIAPQPTPTLEPFIVEIAPRGDGASSLAQIRVRFAHDLIPLEALETPAEAAALAHFSLDPALPGHFRFLTPKLIGFQADVALPLATRVRVTLAAGLKDTQGDVLARDLSWTFSTRPIAIDPLPGTKTRPSSDQWTLTPTIDISANTALDPASLAEHAALVSADGKTRVPLALEPTPAPSPSATDTPPPDLAFDAARTSYAYALQPTHALAAATAYDIVIDPGVLPAAGNVPTSEAERGRLQTFGALTYTGISSTGSADDPDRFTGGAPQLAFSNMLDAKTLAGSFTISPAPSDLARAAIVSDNSVVFNATTLLPQTTYTITIAPTLADRFGQTLGRTVSATFRTGDLAPAFWAPGGRAIFPASRNLALDLVSTNVARANAVFKRVAAVDLIDHDTPRDDTNAGLLPATPTWPALALAAPKNRETTYAVPLRATLGGAMGVLAYGARAKIGTQLSSNGVREARYASAVGLVQLTNLGVFAQYFPESGLVRVHHLSDGSPVTHASVEVYPSQWELAPKDRKRTTICAHASSDANGIATFDATSFARCIATDTNPESAPAFLTIVREGSDWAYVRTDDDTSAGLFAYNGWSSGNRVSSRGTIYSDRDLYQPGETAHFTAVGWYLVDGALVRGRAPMYTVTLESPSGAKRDLTRAALNAYGTFSLPFAIPKDAALGYWTIRATAGNGETLVGSFRVAEFKPPNFKVALTLDKTVAERGDRVTGTATSTYLFGAPVEGAVSTFTVTRAAAALAPPHRDDFSFGPQWFWPDVQPDATTDVLQAQTRVDGGGKSSQAVTVASDLPFPMTYEVDAQTTDVSNLAVADSATFTALPAPTLIGLKTNFVGSAGTPLAIGTIVTDAAGNATSGVHVVVQLQRAEYTHATSVDQGSETPITGVTYSTVASADVTSGNTADTVSLVPPRAGTYRVHANLADAKDDATASDVEVWVGGAQDVAWTQDDPNRLTVTLDKATYRIGDRVTALVQSPFREGDLYLAVVRHGVLWKTLAHVNGAAPTASFVVTPAMLPNAVVEAVLVRRGAVPAGGATTVGNAFARNGFASFSVALDGKYVQVSAHADRARLAPGAQQRVHMHVVDAAGKPVHGQCTVIVANEAVLQLTGYRPPDLVKLVYGEQPISTRFADNRDDVVLQSPQKPLDKGFGFGGGLAAGAADTRVRRAFSPLAYYAGSIVTDANGDAQASFALPDDLTTWRVLVVVATSDGRFGNGEATFIATKPLLANPVVPQFARPGDRFEAGVAVTNPEKRAGTLAIHGTLAGPLAFEVDGKSQASIDLQQTADPLAHAYRFRMVARGAGDATSTFRVALGSATDAFAIPVRVIERATTESVVSTGTTTSSAMLSLAFASSVPRDAGGLHLVFASSIVPDALVAAEDIFRMDDPLAETVASQLSAAADLVRLAQLGAIDPVKDAPQRVRNALAALALLQRDDGGFASYPGDKTSDPYASMTALAALGRVRADGSAVDGERVAHARTFVAKILADPGAWRWCTTSDCKATLRIAALTSLAAAGDRRSSFVSELIAQSRPLDLSDRIRLARIASGLPGFATQANALATDVAQHIYDAGAPASIDVPERYAWAGSTTLMQSGALQLFIERGAPTERTDALTTSLLALRRNGSWGCACENAAALSALTDLVAHDRTPVDFTAHAVLAGKPIASATFAGPKARAQSFDLPMTSLPLGAATLALAKDGSGTLHYSVTYTYRVAGPQRGVLAGLRVTREIRSPGDDTVLASMGLTLPVAPTTLPAGRVYDVGLQIITDHPVDRVLIDDPLPAGMEAVDTSFATSSKAIAARGDSWNIGYQHIHHDRIEAFADRLGPGIYALHYLVRTVTPGTYAWPGAQARLADRPEEFGRSAATSLIVK